MQPVARFILYSVCRVWIEGVARCPSGIAVIWDVLPQLATLLGTEDKALFSVVIAGVAAAIL